MLERPMLRVQVERLNLELSAPQHALSVLLRCGQQCFSTGAAAHSRLLEFPLASERLQGSVLNNRASAPPGSAMRTQVLAEFELDLAPFVAKWREQSSRGGPTDRVAVPIWQRHDRSRAPLGSTGRDIPCGSVSLLLGVSGSRSEAAGRPRTSPYGQAHRAPPRRNFTGVASTAMQEMSAASVAVRSSDFLQVRQQLKPTSPAAAPRDHT